MRKMDISNIGIIILTTWNITTFLMMGIDKYKAAKGMWRIREKTLLISAFLFGGIGILCGMYVFRHKTKHWSFKILVPAAVVINLILCYFIYVELQTRG